MDNNALMPGRILFAYDANRDRPENEFTTTINGIRLLGDNIIRGGDTVLALGVLHKILHPFGYQMQATPDSNIHLVEEEVSKRLDIHVNMFTQSAEYCKDDAVDFEVKIIAGNPIRKVVLQEAKTCNATWVILDRHLKRDAQFYLRHIPCKVATVLENFTVEVSKNYISADKDTVEQHEVVFAMSKPVPLPSAHDSKDIQPTVYSFTSFSESLTSMESADLHKSNSVSSLPYRFREQSFSSNDDYGSRCKQEKSGKQSGCESKYHYYPFAQKQKKTPARKRFSGTPLCAHCEMKTELHIKESMRFSYSEIQLATDDFSTKNLLGEGGYGHVYKGVLKDGQLIAAKVRKETSTQGFQEFNSEVYVLSFAGHKNIVMLLGYCCKENMNILVYEYICNKSLEWHLFDDTEAVLDWQQRRAIAIGTAKGLRFLHEECRGSPIIHRDLRPSNILLTHDFVPMLGDFGLAKWKTNDDPIQTRILGTFGYLAPEYIENGIVSVRTDVYSFGIVLIQLISGRKTLDSNIDDRQQSLRQWAEPLIESLALHNLSDPRLGESYDPYQLYLMARTAYLCVKSDPEMRPSMGEVVNLLEGNNDRLQNLEEQFIPHFSK